MASLLGPVELHADNSIALGKSLFQLVAARTLPQQAVPTLSLMCETFTYSYGEVASDSVRVRCKREYFFRPRVCFGAWRHGKIKELNCLVGAHPLEDVIHIHAWVQLHLMHMGHLPSHFYWMPGMVPRSPELVPGRVYPLLSESEHTGVLCLCPGGQSYGYVHMAGCDPEAVALESWQQVLRAMRLQVAPLIHRRGAVVKLDDAALRVLVPQQLDAPSPPQGWKPAYQQVMHSDLEDGNYLDYFGQYALANDDSMDWVEAHARLVSLGTHVVVKKERVQALITQEMGVRLPRGEYTHVKGWLRYPESCDVQGNVDSIFVAFRVASAMAELEDVCVLPVSQDHCTLCQDAPGASVVDYLHI
jgi:hypothetical protein